MVIAAGWGKVKWGLREWVKAGVLLEAFETCSMLGWLARWGQHGTGEDTNVGGERQVLRAV